METNQTSNASAPAAAPAPVAKPPSKIMRIAGGVIGIIGIIAIVAGASQLYSAFFVLPGCDAQASKDTLAKIFKEHKFEPTGYTSVTTVSSSKDQIVCNAVLPLPDGANLVADYTIYWQGWTTEYKYSMHRKAQ